MCDLNQVTSPSLASVDSSKEWGDVLRHLSLGLKCYILKMRAGEKYFTVKYSNWSFVTNLAAFVYIEPTDKYLLSLLCVRNNVRPFTHRFPIEPCSHLQFTEEKTTAQWEGAVLQRNRSIRCQSLDTGSASRSDSQAYTLGKPAHSYHFHTFHCCSCTS